MKTRDQLRPHEIYFLDRVNEVRAEVGKLPLAPEDVPDEKWEKLDEIVHASGPLPMLVDKKKCPHNKIFYGRDGKRCGDCGAFLGGFEGKK